MNIPKALLPHTGVRTRDLLGTNANGDVHSEPRTVDRCKVEEKRTRVVNQAGETQIVSGKVFFQAKDGPFSEDSRVTIWPGTPREREVQAMAVEYMDAPPAPSYWVVYFA